MSASPSGLPNGQNKGPPPGAPPILKRKLHPTNPLVARKKPVPKPAAPRPPKPPAASGHNGLIDLGAKNSRDELTSSVSRKELEEFLVRKNANGGWTDPLPPDNFAEFTLFASKGSDLKDVHHHIMRFTRPDKPEDYKHGTKADDFNIDPTDQDRWPRPVTLYRRDPRAIPEAKPGKEEPPPQPTVDDAEAERLAQQKAEREAQRAIDMAQIAPVMRDNNPKPKKSKQKKQDQIVTRYQKDTEDSKKQSQLRYQETYPWNLQDAEGNNAWVGRRVAPLSEMNVAFIVTDGGFRMVPLEGYYRFAAKQKFAKYTLQEAENKMKQKLQPPRWILTETEEKKKKAKEYAEYREFMGGRARVKTESATSRAAPRSERNEDFELDMSGDEFQDDDEAPGFDADDEEQKDAKSRVRRDQLGANLFGDADEEEIDKEEEAQKEDKILRKVFGKDMKKALKKREKALIYDSDSSSGDSNPFSESSSSDSADEKPSDADKDKDDKTKDDKAKAKADQKEKPASTATSKGNTPSAGNLKPKPGDTAAKKGKKRPGSPSLSETSGNESSRRKGAKKARTGANTSVAPSRSTTPLPGGGRGKGLGGAASDGEATGGEMSDGARAGKKNKIKLVGTGTGARGTPVGSRAGSPAPTASKAVSPARANPTSPTPGSPSGSPPPGGPTGPVEEWEVVQVLTEHPEGMSIGHLLRPFGHRVGDRPGQMSKKEWIKVIRSAAAYGADKLLRLKT